MYSTDMKFHPKQTMELIDHATKHAPSHITNIGSINQHC